MRTKSATRRHAFCDYSTSQPGGSLPRHQPRYAHNGVSVDRCCFFEDTTGVYRSRANTFKVSHIRIARSSVVGPHSQGNIAVEAVQEVAQQQTSICRQDLRVHFADIHFLRRPKVLGELSVVPFVFEIELVNVPKSLSRNLPDTGRVVEYAHASRPPLDHDIVTSRSPLPNRVCQIASYDHVIVLYGSDADQILQRQFIELGYGDNVTGQPLRVTRCEHWRSRFDPLSDSRIGCGL